MTIGQSRLLLLLNGGPAAQNRESPPRNGVPQPEAARRRGAPRGGRSGGGRGRGQFGQAKTNLAMTQAKRDAKQAEIKNFKATPPPAADDLNLATSSGRSPPPIPFVPRPVLSRPHPVGAAESGQ